MIDDLIDAVTEYVSKEDTKRTLETRVLRPCLDYVNDKVAWGVRLFQLVAVLVVVQSAMLVFLMVREVRRR